jgi:ADP-ribose pyrophosphatase YjhB (NUDIX family)
MVTTKQHRERGQHMAMKKIGAAAVIFNSEGHVLLVKHGYGHENWEIPGGGSEPNESPEETAVREVREETGLTVTLRRMTGVYYVEETDSMGFVFLCDSEGGEPTANDRSELTDCGYWPVDALPRPISNWTVRRIQDVVSGAPPAMVSIPKVTYSE